MKKRPGATKKQAEQNLSASPTISETNNELGVIKIHENVIASIVRKATCSVDGVIRLAGSALVDNIAGFVGSRKIHDRAITSEIDESSVQIEVKVNISYGAYVPDVAQNIQTNVMEQVEKITGMTVKRVNVIVQELETLEDIAAEEEEEEEKE